MNYYNEIDPGAAAWLRELIDRGEIPRGIVDTRSIVDVRPSDLRGFTQCHFFAGIAGWPLALRLAGVPPTTRCWTGSPPCQPFSLAGKQIGFEDPRHLAPSFLDLIAESNPPVLFGEQVRNAIGKHWLDFIFMDMEAEGYICGSAVLPAGGTGAPHQRDRIVFGAVADGRSEGSQRRLRGWADAQREILDRYPRCGGATGILSCAPGSLPDAADGTGLTEIERAIVGQLSAVDGTLFAGSGRAGSYNEFWADADWLRCRDGNFRPVEPGTFPLGNGVPARVGRLRGYGNAIVPQVCANFIRAFVSAATETIRSDI